MEFVLLSLSYQFLAVLTYLMCLLSPEKGFLSWAAGLIVPCISPNIGPENYSLFLLVTPSIFKGKMHYYKYDVDFNLPIELLLAKVIFDSSSIFWSDWSKHLF